MTTLFNDVDDGDLEEYPLPLGARLKGEWFPFHHDAFLGSDYASTVDPEAAWFGVVLWAEAARQDPAGTLPTDLR
ncbi:MAG: hypothetical protein AAFU61_12410, partial [Pseudomonadota bacterium]